VYWFGEYNASGSLPSVRHRTKTGKKKTARRSKGISSCRFIPVGTENSIRAENAEVPYIHEMLAITMSALFVAIFAFVASSFRTRVALQSEILALRHQLAVLQKNAPRRLRLHRPDRFLWVLLSRWWPGWRRSLHIVRPDTVIAWHRRAFAWYWTQKSRRRPGRPNLAAEIRILRNMSQANPLWGAPRIHGELLKLGIEVARSTVAKYLRRPPKPPSQTWRTFLTNHMDQMPSSTSS
jgi:hypothetical protein